MQHISALAKAKLQIKNATQEFGVKFGVIFGVKFGVKFMLNFVLNLC
jgi:hypothetical protein